MNEWQRVNEALDTVLGSRLRAIWLCVKVDEKPLHVVAKEFDRTVAEIKAAVDLADWVLERADLAPKIPPKPPLKPCYEGFHQMGDGE